MGWDVIAFAGVDLKVDARGPMVKDFVDTLNKTDYVKLAERKNHEAWINIEMYGNKAIDYSEIIKILDKFKDIIDEEDIAFSEYCETGDGAYWEKNA